MANGPGLSTAKGGEVYVGNEIESLTLLDVLYANHFEGQHFCREDIVETEANFYRGAPPLWLNFHVGEQAQSGDVGIQLIKRDGYDELVQQIQQSRKCPGISIVKLFHQPGCGGTTLAMQVLWDLRKTFRCAVLEAQTTSDILTSVPKQVVQLFTAGSRNVQNTVLLLLNDEQLLDNLEERIKEEIAAQMIVPKMPVVVLFCCVRKNTVLPHGNRIVLRKSLSDAEMQKFNEKKSELSQRFPDQHEQFHGFNIVQTHFSQDYARRVSSAFTNVLKAKRKTKSQMAAFLALLNSYVPGSYLLESQCLDFLKQKESTHGGISLEPFSDLIITFKQNTSNEKRVRMAHAMIAQSCVEVMAEEGVTRSNTARNFIIFFCRDEVCPYLLDFLKYMLIKREEKEEEDLSSTEIKEKKFSRLILDIQRIERKSMSASVLKVASEGLKYPGGRENPFFPQALARFYYIEIKHYYNAEWWAKKAKDIDPSNSFIADTLGQVYKNQLKNKKHSLTSRQILQLATKAIKAFKHEEELAEKESASDMIEDGNRQVPHVHNTRGQFGYLQVCEILYNSLVCQNEKWKDVLTREVSLGSVLKTLGDNKLFRFNDLIKSLQEDVMKKCEFLRDFLTYSKPGLRKQDPSECWKNVSTCYRLYVKCPAPDLVMTIMNKLNNDNEEKRDTPESCIAAVLKEWPTDNQGHSPNLMELIDKTKRSYENTFGRYFRSRHLRPLFYLGKAGDKIVPANAVQCCLENQDTTEEFIDYMINKDKIFRDLRVQKLLFRCEGEVKNYSIITQVGGCNIEMKANMQERAWVSRYVSFYIGFTIRGPEAFGIQTRQYGNPRASVTSSTQNTTWEEVQPKITTTNNVRIYSLQSEAGTFQCTESGLRWVCRRKVSFTYQIKSWDAHQEMLEQVSCIPGGPLLEITVTDGKLVDVYLPHEIHVDDLTATSERLAVLHSKEVGNFLEQVSEVETSHVKLFHPWFTTHGVLVREDVP